jgi:NAD(P)-dependent dehydrogenase (short-subunit alcohol dehydrogenase family)
MAVRDVAKGERAAAAIRADHPDATLEIGEVDLASLASIRAFAARWLATNDRLDLLIDNAGVMACPQGQTADGFELQFGTNHLGHFLLTNLVAPALVPDQSSRVVVLSSGGHKLSDVDLDDPGFTRTPYDKWTAYGRAKTANALFAVGFDARHRSAGIRAFSVHPGVIATELSRHMDADDFAALRARRPTTGTMRMKSTPEGAATSVWAATSTELDGRGGLYCENCEVAEIVDEPGSATGVMAYALDPARADALWYVSERLVGLA